MRLPLAAAVVLSSSLALAQATSATPPPQGGAPPVEEKQEDKSGFDRSKFVVRGGVTFDFSGAINLGGTSNGPRAALGVNGGVGYFIFPRFEVDLDLRFVARFSPSPVAVELFEITPGARWRPIDQLQLRVGVPIPLVPQAGVGVLAGAAFIQRIAGNVAFVVGADYTYYFTDYWRQVAPSGRIEFHAGVQAYF